MAGTELVKGMLVQDGCDGEIALQMEGYATEDPEGIIDQVMFGPLLEDRARSESSRDVLV